MNRNPLESYSKIGSIVGLSGISVRSRILKMYKAGFLQGMYLIPSPLNFHRYPWAVVFKNVKSAASKLNEILTVENVVFAWIEYDNDVIVVIFSRSLDEKDRSAVELSDILGVGIEKQYSILSLLPPNLADSKLSRIDWKILENVLFNPRMATADISRLTHLSRKTVKNHIDAMMFEKKLYTVYLSDFTKTRSGILYGMTVQYETRKTLMGLLELNLKPVFYTDEPRGVYLINYAESVKDMEILRERVESMRGINGIYISIPKGGIFAEKRVKCWIMKEIDNWNSASFR